MIEEFLVHLETTLLQHYSEPQRQYPNEVNDSATLAWRISSGGRGQPIDHSHSSNSGKIHADSHVSSWSSYIAAYVHTNHRMQCRLVLYLFQKISQRAFGFDYAEVMLLSNSLWRTGTVLCSEASLSIHRYISYRIFVLAGTTEAFMQWPNDWE
jgi:hypothetical protein